MVIKIKDEKDYYREGTKEDIIISNSFLNALDPEMGGSPQKAINFFDQSTEEKESKGIENGRTIHSYAEHPESFAIAEIPRPSETLGDLCDEFHRIKLVGDLDEEDRKNVEIVSSLKTPGGQSAEVLEIRKAYEDLAKQFELEDFKILVPIFRKARKNVGAYTTYKEATVINTVLNKGGVDYIKQLIKLENKVSLTKADKFTIENVIQSLRKNEIINRHLALSNLFDTNVVIKELNIYFTFKNGKKGKARIDNIYIDFDQEIIYINDLKTTSRAIGKIKEVIEDRKYYRQLRFYELALQVSGVLQKILKENNIERDIKYFKIVHQIFAVETVGFYIAQVIDTTAYSVKGMLELSNLFERAKFHIDENNWTETLEEVEGGGVIKIKPDA